MALSRIWSAFIVIAIAMAGYKCFSGDGKVLSRMLTGKADDAYDTIYYNSPAPAPEQVKHMAEYGYLLSDSLHPPAIMIVDKDRLSTIAAANPTLQVYTWSTIQSKLVKKADGIIETCKSAVTISIGLIGIIALFMGFMSIAEKAGGINLLSRIIGPFFSRLFPELPPGP